MDGARIAEHRFRNRILNWSRIMAATLLGLSGIATQAVTDDEVSALLAESLLSPDWETIFTVENGAGYKDNVLLAHGNEQGKAFVSARGELLVLRFAPLGPRFNLFANADVHHYFGGDVSHQEYTSFNQAQYEYDFNERFQGSIAAQYYYQDQ